MNKVYKFVRKLAKKHGLDSAKIEQFEGRYVVTDTFVTILASNTEAGMGLWPQAHKNFIDKWWEGKNNDQTTPKNTYEKAMKAKLAKCNRKPEVSVIEDAEEDGISYVVYTDTTDIMVAEAERFKEFK